ncbi:reverse transcriptase domain-containing protein [Tanacetum coccineum]
MPSHVKTYDGSGNPEDHLKLFQAAAKKEKWAMPTWCHMFNLTLTENPRVWFDKLPRESIDSYKDLRIAFRENYLQQTKHIKDPVEIHHIKQRDGESTEDFMEIYKAEILDVEGAPECMKISGFMHVQIDENDQFPCKFRSFIKELKQNDKPKAPKKGETVEKDKPIAILMIQPWERAPARNKKPDGPGHHTPHWIQRRNHLAARTYIFASKNRRRRAFHFRMDELHGYQVTIPTQWNNRQARYKKNPCRTIHGTWNIEIPSSGGNSDVMKQQSHSNGMCNDLRKKGRKELCALLRQNLDVFAWKPADMTGVPRHMAEHRLNVREGCPPVRQKKRGQAPERNKAIQEEVEKLVDAGIMKEVHYHSWLSNPVMVKKHDGSWRMCVDFKDLNKACPQDGYPLPEIDWKVESLCGYPFKCFLDAYKGYHQIKMAEEDEEKTAFITSQGIFCYTKMPFGLKNVGATYQRLVDKAFQKQIGRNLEVYVDDLVIKSHTEEELIQDIAKTFKTLRQINMKLNPKKCTFGMQEGIFLGYKVNAEGLKVCPDKADAVLSLPSLGCLKDVQKLNGKLTSLNRFLSKSAEKSLPFFKTLKKCTKKSDFQWTQEAEVAFKQMKKLIAELPMLTAPKEKEELIMYLAAA